MLSKFDDFPIHQTPLPVAHVDTTDRNVYDRYWFNGYAEDGEFYFGVAMGLYSNLGILDGAFSLVRDGEQHSFHVSRRAPSEPSDTSAGPFRIEVVEPMRSVRVVLEPNETGIECDLLFRARTACVQEGRQTLHRGKRAFMDATRFAQFGRWEGSITIAGQRLNVEASRVFGTKDRSWGIRPVGDPDPAGAPGPPPGIYFLWAPIHWDDCCTHLGIFEYEDGHPWHQDGAVVPVYDAPQQIPGTEDPGTRYMVGAEREIHYVPGTRRARAADLALLDRDGSRIEMQLEPLLRFQMKGLGYTHFEWGHGRWKGELAMAGEHWKSDELDPLALDNLHIQQVMRARWGDKVGVGVMEQLCIGPHEPSGFTEFLDGAKG